jgi:hypothetical protein
MSSEPVAAKLCQECQQERPAAAFFPSTLRADGLTDRCKQCVFESSRRQREWRRERMESAKG